MYPAFLRNEGTLDCREETHFSSKAISIEVSGYRGEVFFEDESRKADVQYWSPNRIVANVEPTMEGRLFLNQNQANSWKANRNREVEPYNGLVSTRVTPQDTQITFYYLPDSFIVGAILSFFGIGLAFFLIRYAQVFKDRS